MPTVVRMPEIATGTGEAAVHTWLVAVGDAVAAGQPLAEIETEKAVVEFESDTAGILAAIVVEAGAAARVGAPIAVLAEAGESLADAIAAAGLDAAPAPQPAPTPAPTPAPEPALAPEPEPEPAPAPAMESEPDPDATPAGDRVFATPLVRRLARERGIDLHAVPGTGPRGRIVRRDLEAWAQTAAPAPTAAAPASGAPAAPAQTAAPSAEAAEFTDIPHTGMRRAIARRLSESKATVPHFYLTAHCRVDELLALRARINDAGDIRISVNDLVVKAVAAALRDVPDANATWGTEAIRRYTGVDIAVAVSVDGGLLTPVIRGVDRMPLGELSASIREHAERARAGRLKQHELEGGSFSVSNLGMYGTTEFAAIINPPHAGILAVGAAERRPVVAESGQLEVATVMTVTLSADHRVLDGALAATWLAAFQRRIENPVSMLV